MFYFTDLKKFAFQKKPQYRYKEDTLDTLDKLDREMDRITAEMDIMHNTSK